MRLSRRSISFQGSFDPSHRQIAYILFGRPPKFLIIVANISNLPGDEPFSLCSKVGLGGVVGGETKGISASKSSSTLSLWSVCAVGKKMIDYFQILIKILSQKNFCNFSCMCLNPNHFFKFEINFF